MTMAYNHFATVAALATARYQVSASELHLVSIATTLASGDAVSRETITSALARCDHARQDLDRAIYAALGTMALNGRPLAAGDPGDMRAALFAALDRVEAAAHPSSNASEHRWVDHEAGFASSVGA